LSQLDYLNHREKKICSRQERNKMFEKMLTLELEWKPKLGYLTPKLLELQGRMKNCITPSYQLRQ
jgi:hypothetical protein